MSKVIGYVDWDTIVQKAEANIETLEGNTRRAKVGLLCEEEILKYALKERDKFPKPIMEEEKQEEKPVEEQPKPEEK